MSGHNGAEKAVLPTAPLLAAMYRVAAEAGFDVSPKPHSGAPGMGSFCRSVFGDDKITGVLRKVGRIGPTRADALACALKLHPYEIWGESWLVSFPADWDEKRVHEAARRKQALREYNARKKQESDQRRKEVAA
jgi:hypothetical protein